MASSKKTVFGSAFSPGEICFFIYFPARALLFVLVALVRQGGEEPNAKAEE